MAIPEQTEWLRARTDMKPVGVDFEKNAIFGMVLAQEGEFKDEGRGEFDRKALKQIVKLGNQRRGGLRSNFGHATLSGDGVGTHLGRVSGLRMDTVTVEQDGSIVALEAVRGDLRFADSAFESPNGNLAGYVMKLAHEDPGAISSSLVLKTDEETRLDRHGRPKVDEEGRQLPPLWRPTELHGADIVAVGAAVDDLLSADINADGLNDAIVHKGWELLNGFLPGESREVVAARLSAWMDRALSLRFGDEPTVDETEPTAAIEILRQAYRERFLSGRTKTP